MPFKETTVDDYAETGVRGTMTKEKAIWWVNDRMCYGRYNPTKHNPFQEDEVFQAGMMAITALKKSTHMRYKMNVDEAVCPVCGTRLDPQHMNGEILIQEFYRFCPYCGQAIKWEEDHAGEEGRL